jgi:hypothetical protein
MIRDKEYVFSGVFDVEGFEFIDLVVEVEDLFFELVSDLNELLVIHVID